MSSYCATSPTSSAPWARRRARTSSMSSTANMMLRMPSVFAGAFFGSALAALGLWNFRQLKPAVAVRGPHHCDVDSDSVEPDDAVHPTSLDWHLALQLETKFDKESD